MTMIKITMIKVMMNEDDDDKDNNDDNDDEYDQDELKNMQEGP